jgi:RecA-family ATPase
LGLEVKGGCVAFLSAEEDEAELHRRIDSCRIEFGIRYDDLAELHVIPLVGEDAFLAKFDKGEHHVKPTQLFSQIEEKINEWGAKLVILDTQSDVFACDANDPAQARQCINLLRGLCLRANSTVLLLGHPSMSGLSSGSGKSGSMQWSNAVRSRVYLERVLDAGGIKELDPDVRALVVKKANYGRSDERVSLRWRNGVFVPDDGKTSAKSTLIAEAAFLQMLDTYTKEGRNAVPTTGTSYAPKLFADDKRCPVRDKRALKDAMDALFGKNEIRTVTSGSRSRERHRIVRVQQSTEDAK